MTIIERADAIAYEVARVLSQVPAESTDRLVEAILEARRIFVAGAGRSGLMTRAFAMRLMHMGFEVFVVGETTTPAIGGDDLLVVGSGSGETASLVSIAQKAKRVGSRLAHLGILPESSIGRAADLVVRIPAPVPKGKALGAVASRGPRTGSASSSIQPMGSLFEQCLLVLLDATVVSLMERRNEVADTMYARHANLE